MPLDIDDFARLTSLISAAGLDRSRWQAFLDELSRVSGGVRTHLFGYDVETGMDLGMVNSGYDPDWQASYATHYGARNAWVPGFFKRTPGIPVFSEQMCPRAELEKTEFYNDWVKPQEDILGGGGVILAKEASRMFVLGGNIRRIDVDRLESQWMRLVRLLTPHLANAFEVNRIMAARAIETHALQDRGAGRATAVLLVNARRFVLMANPAARHLLESGDLIRQDIAGRLSFVGCGERAFQRALHGLESASAFLPQTFEVRDATTGIGYACRTAAVNSEDLDVSPYGVLVGPNEAAMIVTLSPRASAANAEAALARQYGLSPRECRVAMGIVSGLSAQEIAERHRTSVFTVRNQIRSVMSKLEVRRQIDVVRLIERSRGPWGSFQEGDAPYFDF